MHWFYLALLALAAARATHLIADDDFPFGALRDRLDRDRSKILQWVGSGLGCTFCVSIWAGFFSALLATKVGWVHHPAHSNAWADFTVLWFAYAQLIVMLEAWLWGRD